VIKVLISKGTWPFGRRTVDRSRSRSSNGSFSCDKWKMWSFHLIKSFHITTNLSTPCGMGQLGKKLRIVAETLWSCGSCKNWKARAAALQASRWDRRYNRSPTRIRQPEYLPNKKSNHDDENYTDAPSKRQKTREINRCTPLWFMKQNPTWVTRGCNSGADWSGQSTVEQIGGICSSVPSLFCQFGIYPMSQTNLAT
jgi:hypothetical protein